MKQKHWKSQSIQPEMDARIIKQPDITRNGNGPQSLSGTALLLPIKMFSTGNVFFLLLLFHF